MTQGRIICFRNILIQTEKSITCNLRLPLQFTDNLTAECSDFLGDFSSSSHNLHLKDFISIVVYFISTSPQIMTHA